MAFTDLSKLQNITPISLDFSNLTSAKNATAEIINTATKEVGAAWFNIPIMVIFLFLIWFLVREDGFFNYDITRGLLISSGFCLLISMAFILSGLVNSILTIVWFATIFTISFVAVLKLKEKNL